MFGIVNESLADGFTLPKRTFMRPLEYSCPGMMLKRIALVTFFKSFRRTGPGAVMAPITLPFFGIQLRTSKIC